MLLDRVDLFLAEAAAVLASRPSVPKLPSFWWRPARPAICAISAMVRRRSRRPSNFSRPAKATWVDVHVEAHADGVGGDEIIDLAALEHRDLGVAGGGRQRAHHHRRAALEAAQHLGQRVDLLGGEGDDRRARRQARQLDAAGIAQGREARAADDLGLGQQLADDRLQRVRAEDQRLLAAAGAQHPVGEDVAALRVDAELGLVDRGKGEIALEVAVVMAVAAGHRHALGGAQEIARAAAGRSAPRRSAARPASRP